MVLKMGRFVPGSLVRVRLQRQHQRLRKGPAVAARLASFDHEISNSNQPRRDQLLSCPFGPCDLFSEQTHGLLMAPEKATWVLVV